MTVITTTDSQPSRPLGLIERHVLVRRNLGIPVPLTILVVYPSAPALPDRVHLAQRIEAVQRAYPLLHATIQGRATTTPHFALREPRARADVLREALLPAVDAPAVSVLEDEMRRMQGEDVDARPMWQVSLLTSGKDEGAAYLALSAHHEIIDGRGLAALLEMLLSSEPLEDTKSHVEAAGLALAPSLEDTHKLQPPLSYLLPQVLRELVLPLFPSFVQNYFRPAALWPEGEYTRKPIECEWHLALLSLDAELVTALKHFSAQNGIKGLHAVLKVAAILSAWVLARRDTHLDPLVIRADSPRSVRDEQAGHPRTTGNYRTPFEHRVTPQPQDDFWSYASELAAALRDPALAQKGLWELGMLMYVPNKQAAGETGWEEFFRGWIRGERPFRYALGVSNLGKLDLPAGATDVLWAQTAGVFGSVVEMALVGHEGGIRVVSSWREGAKWDRADVDEFHATIREILEGLVAGRRTVEQLVGGGLKI